MTLLIRPEAPADEVQVQRVIDAAFAAGDLRARAESTGGRGGEPVEVGLNAALRRHPAWIRSLSLVAVLDGRVVGQLTSSYGTLTMVTGGELPLVGVGPVAVLPEQQGAGIGSSLMRALVDAAAAAGEPALVVLGSPDYYGRFGFVAAADLGIDAPDPSWGRYFQARPLTARDLVPAGRYRYAAPFDAL